MCDDDYNTKLSLTKNGLCYFKKSDSKECDSCNNCKSNNSINSDQDYDKLLEKFMEKKHNIINKIKELLNDCSAASGKKNKAKITLDIYEIIYYNFYFTIIHPKFLLTNIHKILELILEYDLYMEIQKENEKYINIIKFMEYIKNYINNNNINLDDIANTQDLYDLFLLNFVNHLEKFYNDEINNKKSPSEIDNKKDNIIVDIDNINIVSLILDI
jgi:hypothetical protein